MPDDEPVVADTSPLLNLALVDRLDLLDVQFETVHTPQQVWDELATGDEGLPELRRLRERDVLTVVPVERSDLFVEIAGELDVGEAAAIVYAIENDASLVLLNERDGRRVARRHDLDVTGVIGILLRGARDGTVDLQAELDALRDAGFWIDDDLYAEVLRRNDDEGA
jgi:predicted nucleic acid-binding protein